MRLSTRGQYAVRAMVSLSCQSEAKPVALRDISESEGISLSYLEQLFVKLRKGNIVKSVRGPGGGYVLARPASEISVGTVISVVEEPMNPVACLDAGAKGCARADICATQGMWKGLAQRMSDFLDAISIEDLVKEVSVIKRKGNERPEKPCTPAAVLK